MDDFQTLTKQSRAGEQTCAFVKYRFIQSDWHKTSSGPLQSGVHCCRKLWSGVPAVQASTRNVNRKCKSTSQKFNQNAACGDCVYFKARIKNQYGLALSVCCNPNATLSTVAVHLFQRYRCENLKTWREQRAQHNTLGATNPKGGKNETRKPQTN